MSVSTNPPPRFPGISSDYPRLRGLARMSGEVGLLHSFIQTFGLAVDQREPDRCAGRSIGSETVAPSFPFRHPIEPVTCRPVKTSYQVSGRTDLQRACGDLRDLSLRASPHRWPAMVQRFKEKPSPIAFSRKVLLELLEFKLSGLPTPPSFGAWRSLASASALGAEGRRFESCRPDYKWHERPSVSAGGRFCCCDGCHSPESLFPW